MRKIKAIVVGAGYRAQIYASYAKLLPDSLEIVGVAEPNKYRRDEMKRLYNLADNCIFKDASELAQREKFADAVINGTMDREHVRSSVLLMEKGYDILLEKPFAINEEEVKELCTAAKKYRRKIMICHVLRYASFYQLIKDKLNKNTIGAVYNVQMTEHVSYYHMATSFLRGKWRSEAECGCPLLLSKCSHDLDLLMWLKSDSEIKNLSSFGSDFSFAPDKKSCGAGTRCLLDCGIESTCNYSAKKLYLDHEKRWAHYVWENFAEAENLTYAEKEKFLCDISQYGECVWNNKHDVVDHQTVMIEFEDGAIASLNLVGGTAKSERNIHILATEGEIKGTFEESKITIRKINPATESGYDEETIDLTLTPYDDFEVGFNEVDKGIHDGGEYRMMDDFIRLLNDEPVSNSCTTLADSIRGHMVIFALEESRHQSKVLNFRI